MMDKSMPYGEWLFTTYLLAPRNGLLWLDFVRFFFRAFESTL
jgi:hypothetical protein